MFYQEVNFSFYPVLIPCLQSEIDTGKTTFETAKSAKFTSVCTKRVPYHVRCLFCMGAYKHDVVVAIRMGAYIHGVLILCGYLFIPILWYRSV